MKTIELELTRFKKNKQKGRHTIWSVNNHIHVIFENLNTFNTALL